MSNRVLNFSEFNTKYSSETSTPANASDMANAAANFEEGFDDSTYDQPQIGPNRPVSGNYDITPASSGLAFNENPSDDMNAPAEDDQNWPGAMAEAGEDDENEPEEVEDDENEPEEVEEDEEDDDEGNPENEEIVEESYSVVKGFIQFINESDEYYADEDETGYRMNPDSYEDDESFCSGCGAIGDKYGYNCGCNM